MGALEVASAALARLFRPRSDSMSGLRRLRLFVRFMVPDGTPCGSPQHTMMACDVPGRAADHSTLEAALCVSRKRRDGDRECENRAA